MKFELIDINGWDAAIKGMRNPLESWDKSDSYWTYIEDKETLNTAKFEHFIGENDLGLMQRLIKGGPEHRKFLRYIHVQFDMIAPLYIWKEFDTYKIGTTANSTSTMHKLASTPITLDCFETDDYQGEYTDTWNVFVDSDMNGYPISLHNSLVEPMIKQLETLRQKYLETKDTKYWKELIRWLPESWLQTRTIDLNYEVLRTIVHQRENHKLSEWHQFIDFVKTLPYADELIFFEN